MPVVCQNFSILNYFHHFELLKIFVKQILSLLQEYIRPAKEDDSNVQSSGKVKEKKEILTKTQKRRITERTNFKGERQRGWDWVDVVKHLYQSGVSSEK